MPPDGRIPLQPQSRVSLRCKRWGLAAVCLVVGEIAFEPIPGSRVLVGSFPGQDMRGDAIEEPAVVRGDDRAAGERKQRFLEAFERFGIQVVGGFVEQQQIAALFEREREVQTVPLAAGQDVRRLLLVGSLETERAHVGAARYLGLADDHVVVAV